MDAAAGAAPEDLELPEDLDEDLPPIHYVTPEEGRAIIDENARRYLGMSGDDFRRRYEAGELDMDDHNVIYVGFMLPLGEPYDR